MATGGQPGQHRGHAGTPGSGRGGRRRGAVDLLAEAQEKLNRGEPLSFGHAEHAAPLESVREVEHDGHRITIRTQYEIEIDGRPLRGHIYVGNDGSVSSHALPAYKFASTVDLVATLIDAFPAEFPAPTRRRKAAG